MSKKSSPAPPAKERTTPQQRRAQKRNSQQPHRVLVLCDLGINRSVTLAGQLKFMGNEVITAGIDNSSVLTLHMLAQWAQTIIVTEEPQASSFLNKLGYPIAFQLWDLGPDTHPRPYNVEMLRKVKEQIKLHPEIDHRQKDK